MKKLAIVAGGLLMFNAQTLLADHSMGRYEVTVTNATYAQVLTPPVVVVHKNRFRVFEVAGSASDGLRTMAETGNPGPLSEELDAEKDVKAVATGGGVIPPGQSMTITVDGPRSGKVSVLGMLATTNDAFFAVQGASAGRSPVSAHVYDAGTEANTELCADIPGPPCVEGSNNQVEEGAEGFIHMHRGFHGVNEGAGDPMSADGQALTDERLDWRGAAAIISIKRKW